MNSKLCNLRGYLVALFLSITLGIVAQVEVTGTVLEPSGDPVIGAVVKEKGNEAAATTTDFDGAFALKVKSDKATLIISCVGMKTKEVALNGQKTVQVVMGEDSQVLDEFVVVGYGTSRKVDITGSVASVSEETLRQGIAANADQMLSGKIPGVQVTANSGAPGAATSIRIRGASSINSSNEPLYIIDGVQMSGAAGTIGGFDWTGDGSSGQTKASNPLAGISPNDIVSIDVLKDASATAIYGAAGANGVIIITTRRGEAGRTSVTFDGYVAWQQTAKRLEMLDLPGFAKYQNDLYAEGANYQQNNTYLDPALLGPGTDWQDAVFRTAFMQNYQLQVSGGNDKITFAASGGWMDQDGIIIGSDFNRFNSRFSVDSHFTKWLKIGGQLAYTRTNETITLNDGSNGIIMQAMTMQPDVPVYDFAGNYASPSNVNGSSSWNPVALALQRNNTLLRQNITGNFYVDVDFLQKFTFRAEYGYIGSTALNKSYLPKIYEGVKSPIEINKIYQRQEDNYFWVQKDYVTYTDRFADKHDLTAMVGFEASASNWEGWWLTKQNLSFDNIHVIGSDGEFVSNDGWKDKVTTVSYFARVNYGFDNRYLLTATMRADGSSKFAKDHKWGYFPSVALAWRANQEAFLRDVTWLNNLKRRAGYGQVGNSNVDPYSYGATMFNVQ
ncbi:MAG: SusC/RagA family TonB-linked outer membrane protein, partial [Muribaculaceae bacterium]|nr:SusC/RagA family TonB-linked outer membrane protein [Muribaculaceae bacterium]